MGLSVGVHLLNLLAIPAIVLVYYFRRNGHPAGTLKALAVSVLILGSIMYIIIPGVVKVASFFELVFVNTFGLPFSSGTLFFSPAHSLIVLACSHTYIKSDYEHHPLVVCYSYQVFSYAMIVIRSNADTP
jgi:hypothetical protein